MTVNLVVSGVGAGPGREVAERQITGMLEREFSAGPGELNVVLTATPDGYAVAFARAIQESAAPRDHRLEVEAALRRGGFAAAFAR